MERRRRACGAPLPVKLAQKPHLTILSRILHQPLMRCNGRYVRGALSYGLGWRRIPGQRAWVAKSAENKKSQRAATPYSGEPGGPTGHDAARGRTIQKGPAGGGRHSTPTPLSLAQRHRLGVSVWRPLPATARWVLCPTLEATSRLVQAPAPRVPPVAPPGGRPLAKLQRVANEFASPRYGAPPHRAWRAAARRPAGTPPRPAACTKRRVIRQRCAGRLARGRGRRRESLADGRQQSPLGGGIPAGGDHRRRQCQPHAKPRVAE